MVGIGCDDKPRHRKLNLGILHGSLGIIQNGDNTEFGNSASVERDAVVTHFAIAGLSNECGHFFPRVRGMLSRSSVSLGRTFHASAISERRANWSTQLSPFLS